MKAAFRKGNELYFKDVEPREMAPNEIKVSVEACGICGTDIAPRPDDAPEARFGHEIAGTILEVAPGVTSLNVGQKIVLDSATPCGGCANCRNGQQELCTSLKTIWRGAQLGFAETIVAPAISATPYEGLTPAVATLQEPLGVAIDMVRLADLKTTSNVLILGQGTIGLFALRLARLAGVRRAFVSEYKWRTGRKKLAESIGVDAFLDPGETPLEKFDFGCKIDRIMVTAPPVTLPTAFNIAAKGAIISFIGIGHSAANITFDADAFHFKKLQLRASFASPALYGPMAVQYLMDGAVDGKPFVTHTFPLSKLGKAMEVAVKDPTAVKVVIVKE